MQSNNSVLCSYSLTWSSVPAVWHEVLCLHVWHEVLSLQSDMKSCACMSDMKFCACNLTWSPLWLTVLCLQSDSANNSRSTVSSLSGETDQAWLIVWHTITAITQHCNAPSSQFTRFYTGERNCTRDSWTCTNDVVHNLNGCFCFLWKLHAGKTQVDPQSNSTSL